MRLLALLAAGLFAGSLLAADEKKDEELILGTWKLEKVDTGGKDGPPAEQVAKMTMVFTKEGKASMLADGKAVNEGEYKIDPAAKVKTIDLTKDGKVTLGIYKFEGDTLTIVLASEGGKDRPTEFKAVDKKGAVVIMKRVKEEKKEK